MTTVPDKIADGNAECPARLCFAVHADRSRATDL